MDLRFQDLSVQAAAKAGAGAPVMVAQTDLAAVARVGARVVLVGPAAVVLVPVDPVDQVPVAAVEAEAIKKFIRKL